LLRHGGEDVLHPASAKAAGALDTACFPLVPYANRIAEGRFRFSGEAVALPPNFADHPHSLHGTGWQSRWRVIERDMALLIMAHDHEGGAAWPWRYGCIQRLTLDNGGLSATLTLINRDTRPMPAGLGFHPYFAARPGDRLVFRCSQTWLTDDLQLATHPAPADAVADWAQGAEVFRADLVDHCHSGWDGKAELIGDVRTIRLSGTATPFLHVHIPPGLGRVGIEPVTHMPNALNRPEPRERTGLRVLAPGETMSIGMRIAIV
jgi:aldose 1-epimerase